MIIFPFSVDCFTHYLILKGRRFVVITSSKTEVKSKQNAQVDEGPADHRKICLPEISP